MRKMIYQIHLSLLGSNPKIWRRILIQSDLLLSDFHKVIQTSMGWTNSHLHLFNKNETCYAEKTDDDFTWEELGHVDYQEMKISDLLNNEEERILYEYDFGDGWEHEIILEKILPGEGNELGKPICLAGKMNCPPEDCGGIRGYSDMLEILKNPDHEEYESFIVWLGGKFDPEHFNLSRVNRLLKSKDFGCVELDD
jgi:hypothetical protein